MLEQLHLRPLHLDDHVQLLHWLTNPALLEFYGGRDANYTIDKIKDDFFPIADTHHRCIVELNNKSLGYVQYYLLDDDELNDYGYTQQQKVYGMDQFIGETELWNQGLGTLLVKTMVHHLLQNIGAKIIVMDPQVKNKRSIVCYKKCGFNIIKLLPKRELHEGKLEDCYLMEYKEA